MLLVHVTNALNYCTVTNNGKIKQKLLVTVEDHKNIVIYVLQLCINPIGWWFVQLEGGSEEGWAPGAFLEPLVSMPQNTEHSIYDGAFQNFHPLN